MDNNNLSKMKDPQPPPKWYKYLKDIFTGTAGGMATIAVGFPLDTLKIRLQSQCSNNKVYAGLWDCVKKTLMWEGVGGFYKGVGSPLCGQIIIRTFFFTSYYEFKNKMQIQIISEKTHDLRETRYKNVFHAGYEIIKQHGIRGAYQGFTPMLLRNTFGFGLYFPMFEATKRFLKNEEEDINFLPAYKVFFSGGFAGGLYWLLMYNLDVVKSTMMADSNEISTRKYKNTIDCILKLYKHEGGYMRFWKGYSACAVRSVPASATILLAAEKGRAYFPSYEFIISLKS